MNQRIAEFVLVTFDNEEDTFITQFFGKFETARAYKEEAEKLGRNAVIYKKMEIEKK